MKLFIQFLVLLLILTLIKEASARVLDFEDGFTSTALPVQVVTDIEIGDGCITFDATNSKLQGSHNCIDFFNLENYDSDIATLDTSISQNVSAIVTITASADNHDYQISAIESDVIAIATGTPSEVIYYDDNGDLLSTDTLTFSSTSVTVNSTMVLPSLLTEESTVEKILGVNAANEVIKVTVSASGSLNNDKVASQGYVDMNCSGGGGSVTVSTTVQSIDYQEDAGVATNGTGCNDFTNVTDETPGDMFSIIDNTTQGTIVTTTATRQICASCTFRRSDQGIWGAIRVFNINTLQVIFNRYSETPGANSLGLASACHSVGPGQALCCYVSADTTSDTNIGFNVSTLGIVVE